MFLHLLIACGSGAVDLNTEPFESAEPTLALDLDPVFDPLNGDGLDIRWTRVGEGTLVVKVLDADGAVLRSWANPTELIWDGRDSAGDWAPVGPYQVQAELTLQEGGALQSELPTALVRLGFDAVYAEDDGGVTALRLPLFWHKDLADQDLSAALSSLSSLETTSGYAADFPPVSTDLGRASSTQGQPSSWRWDSRPLLTLSVGSSDTFGGSGLEYVNMGVEIAGWTVISGVPLTEGQMLVIQRDEPLSETLGVVDEELAFSFVWTDEHGLQRSAGTQRLPMRFYAGLGAPTFVVDDLQYAPWVAAVEPALRGIAGAEPSHDAVVDGLVRWIFEDLGLSYDTRYGASAYVSYNRDWDEAHFRFNSFLDRRYGSVINCSDAASILLTYANMLGAEQYYRILLENFALNEILAIGGDTYTSCPFGKGGCSFSYHAVTSDAGGETIWDATLAEDGDSDPGSSPSERLLVAGLSDDDYLWRLVRSGHAELAYLAQGTMQ